MKALDELVPLVPIFVFQMIWFLVDLIGIIWNFLVLLLTRQNKTNNTTTIGLYSMSFPTIFTNEVSKETPWSACSLDIICTWNYANLEEILWHYGYSEHRTKTLQNARKIQVDPLLFHHFSKKPSKQDITWKPIARWFDWCQICC